MRYRNALITLAACLMFNLAQAEEFDRTWQALPPETLSVSQEDERYVMTLTRDSESARMMSFAAHSRALNTEASSITFTLDIHVESLGDDSGALLFLRFDNANGESLQTYNSEHLVAVTDGWQRVEVSGDVEPEATALAVGFVLRGEGVVHHRHPRIRADGEPLVAESQTADDAAIEASGIDYADLSLEHAPALKALGQVWAVLKYHHPAVTGGEHQWDLALFEQMSLMLEGLAGNHTDDVVSDRLHAWLDALDVSHIEESAGNDAHWANDIPDSVVQRLMTLTERDIEQQRYVGTQGIFLNFAAEPAYNHLAQVDAGFALLSVFRMAGVYEFFAPYRDLAPDRHQALADAITSLTQIRADDEQQATHSAMRVINRYLVSMGDGHVDLASRPSVKPWQGDCAIPAQLILMDGELIVQSVVDGNFDDLLTPGHRIKDIDGIAVAQLIEDSAPYYAGSTPGQTNGRIAEAMRLGACEPVALTIVDTAGATHNLAVERIALGEQSVSRGPVSDNLSIIDNAVYVHLHALEERMFADLATLLAEHPRVVIDARGYPREFLALTLPALFAQDDYEFVRIEGVSLQRPGHFAARGSQPYVAADRCDPCLDNWQGRIALLVDETTVSQGEYTVMALQGLNGDRIEVKTIGSTTAGSNGNVAGIPLPGPMVAYISGISVYYPDGTATQQRGVHIDLPVTYSLDSIQAEQDTILEAALGWLNDA